VSEETASKEDDVSGSAAPALLILVGIVVLALVYLAVWGVRRRGRSSPWKPPRRDVSPGESGYPSEYSAGGGDQQEFQRKPER
jgi:hypothetical protein